jgi:hypothetical protein
MPWLIEPRHQPAQKWLKNRKGRVLSFDDIRHYQSEVYQQNENTLYCKIITPIGSTEWHLILKAFQFIATYFLPF